jgi:hypothetical protein
MRLRRLRSSGRAVERIVISQEISRSNHDYQGGDADSFPDVRADRSTFGLRATPLALA